MTIKLIKTDEGMGTCFGRYSCSCCNCLLLKHQSTSTAAATTTTNNNSKGLSSLIRAHCRRSKQPSSTFILHRQNSTLEFENFMYDYDFQEPTASVLRLQPSISTVVRFDAEDGKLDNFKIPDYSCESSNKLTLNYMSSVGRSLKLKSKESPLLNPILMHYTCDQRIDRARAISSNCPGSSNVECKMINLPASSPSSSSLSPIPIISGPINETSWDHEASDVINAGNELEWDDYQDNLHFTDETDSLIQEIDDLTTKALKETGLY